MGSLIWREFFVQSMPLFAPPVSTRRWSGISTAQTLASILTINLHSTRSLSQKNAPILGQDSISLDELWTPNPEAYLGLCPVKMPNFFMLLCGPNSVPLATMIPMVEFQVDYVAKVIHKIQREHVKSIVVR